MWLKNHAWQNIGKLSISLHTVPSFVLNLEQLEPSSGSFTFLIVSVKRDYKGMANLPSAVLKCKVFFATFVVHAPQGP
jgi:hypothetical protein